MVGKKYQLLGALLLGVHVVIVGSVSNSSASIPTMPFRRGSKLQLAEGGMHMRSGIRSEAVATDL